MKVAITGASGFIGSRLLARHLAQGDAVRVLSRYPSRFFPAGVELYVGNLEESACDLGAFANGVDLLYHCAGELQDRKRMRQVHVEGTRQLLKAFRAHPGRWVQLSSVGAYGARQTGTVSEDDLPNPVGEYEVTKTAADNLVRESGLDHVILRPSNVFGAGMPNQSLIQMARMVRMGLFFFIGKPGASANYVHVDNVVESMLLCGRADAARGRTYIISDWRPMESFIGSMARLMGCPEPSLHMPESLVRSIVSMGSLLSSFPLTPARVDALTTRTIYSTERLQNELGFVFPVSMEAGLKELLAGAGLLCGRQ